MVLDRGSDIYDGAVTCFLDAERSARSLTGLSSGELEQLTGRVKGAYEKYVTVASAITSPPATMEALRIVSRTIETEHKAIPVS